MFCEVRVKVCVMLFSDYDTICGNCELKAGYLNLTCHVDLHYNQNKILFFIKISTYFYVLLKTTENLMICLSHE